MARRLIVGCGYLGMRVAMGWLKQGDSVYATTRTLTRAGELREIGIEPMVWDWLVGGLPFAEAQSQIMFETETKFDTILVAVTHSTQANLPPVEMHSRGLNHLSSLLKAFGWWDVGGTKTQWIYISTTGVFSPSSSHEWLDEESPVCPERPSSIAALAAEQWLASNVSSDWRVVLRPVGIYGPGRVPRWQSIRDKTPLNVDPESYLNLIHVDDLTAIILAVSLSKMRSSLYCISDGEPVRRRDYYGYISKIGSWPPPVFESLQSSGIEPVNRRREGNKRIRNNRIQSELGVRLVYPSYREGLTAILDELRNKPTI